MAQPNKGLVSRYLFCIFYTTFRDDTDRKCTVSHNATEENPADPEEVKQTCHYFLKFHADPKNADILGPTSQRRCSDIARPVIEKVGHLTKTASFGDNVELSCKPKGRHVPRTCHFRSPTGKMSSVVFLDHTYYNNTCVMVWPK